jgi:hypothetical protein
MSMLLSEPTVSIESSLETLVNQIFSSRKITRSDQRVLMSLLLSKDTLTLEESSYIDEVFERLRRGLIHVVD